jgi:hypothetical protein
MRLVVAEASLGFAEVAGARGDADRAARLASAASALSGAAGRAPTAWVPFVRHLDDARAALGDPAWEKAWADGAELDLDAALTLALDR